MKRTIVAPLPLMQFIPAVSRRFTEPTHLAPLVSIFDRIAAGEEVHAACSKPPRHGGTEVCKHGIARLLRQRPAMRVGIAMHSNRLSLKKSREIREIYQRAGGRVSDDAAAKGDWRTGVEDGGCWAGGTDSGFTGEGFDLLLVDDPHRDRARAESAIERDRLWDWRQSVAIPRLEPGGSDLTMHHRWHPDDMIGRLIADGVEYVKLPAIDSDGQALWPERYPIDALRRIEARIGPYAFQSLYQGEPYLRGGGLFNGTHFYDSLPSTGVRFAVGCDFAYSRSTKADYSVAVVLAEHQGIFYVVEVLRMQVAAPQFRDALEALCSRYGGIRPFAWIGGQERGVLDTWRSMGFHVESAPATVDKFTRAQAVSAAWGAGKVLLPHDAPWLNDVVNEVCAFTGVGDRHDDIVDALAAAHHRLGDLTDVVVTSDAVDAFMQTDAGRKYEQTSAPVLALAPPSGQRRKWYAAVGLWNRWVQTEWQSEFLWLDLVYPDGSPVLGPDGKQRREIAKDQYGNPVRDPAYLKAAPFFVVTGYLAEAGAMTEVVPRFARFAYRHGVRSAISSSPFLEAEVRRAKMHWTPVSEPGDDAIAWLEERGRGDSLRMQRHADVRDDLLRVRAAGSTATKGDLGWGAVLLTLAQGDLEGVFGRGSPTVVTRGSLPDQSAGDFQNSWRTANGGRR